MANVFRYLQYNFDADPKWQEYITNELYPLPSMDKLEKYKRKWYNRNVDPDFDVNFDAGQPGAPTNDQSPPPQNNNNNGNTSSQRQTSPTRETGTPIPSATGSTTGPTATDSSKPGRPLSEGLKNKIYQYEGYLKMAFIPAVVLTGWANIISYVICFLAIIRQGGWPQLSKAYALRVFRLEFTQNLIYMFSYLLFPHNRSYLYFLPLAIHYWIGIVEFANLKLTQTKLYNYDIVKKVINVSRENKTMIMREKAKFEIYNIVALIFGVFFSGTSIFLVLFYANFLRIKYTLNENLQGAFTEIDYWVTSKTNSPACPQIARTIVDKVKALCSYIAKI